MMKFPMLKTKIDGLEQKFDLSTPQDRKKYFSVKAGSEIEKLKSFFENGNTFISYFLGKKNAGKGTYSKMFAEVVGEKYIEHISIGDMVREVENDMKIKEKKEETEKYLKKNYRGFVSIEEVLKSFSNRNTKVLLPTEFILTLVKRKIDQFDKKTLFIDGFPRGLDQISYSLFFRDLAGYRYDADIFIIIDVPESVLDERIKWRLVCPKCGTPRNLKLLPVKRENIRYDKKNDEFFFLCDNPECGGERMTKKEGDELGIEPIKERLKLDGELMKKALLLHGIPKVLLKNTVEIETAEKLVDDYELTPEYVYNWDETENNIKITEKPWVITNENGAPSHSLLAPPVVVSMIKQLVKILEL